ncbi:MAG TPA: hypothetical protein VIL78_16745 [Hanamia sp.]
MNLPEIAKIYFHFNPKVLDNLSSLDNKIHKSLFKPIFKNDEINFFSWLSEMKFGIFFDSLNFELEYNPGTNKQTPDWKLKRDDEIIYAEVLRLNLHNCLMEEKIKELKERYINRDKPKAPIMTSYSSGTMDMENFYGKESKLTDKEFKYRSLTTNYKHPFILCIDCSEPRLFLDYLDFEDYFIGGNKGLFYTNRDFGENVSGILIRNMWNQTLFLNNPNAAHTIKNETVQNLNVK